jgi:hypothetical protein
MPQVIKRIFEANSAALVRGAQNIWTIYDLTTEPAQTCVARRFETDNNLVVPVPTSDIIAGEPRAIREAFQMCGLSCITRGEPDDPKIVEVWL